MIDIFEVIQAAPEAHIRALLRLLCESDYEIKKTAIEHPSEGSKKRKRNGDPEILYCFQCEDCFVEEDNTDTSCAYHPGEPEPDEDFFVDYDEEMSGRIDDPLTMKEFPDGYIMDCCNKRLSDKGCKIGRHISGSVLQKPKNGEHERELDEEDEEDEDEEYDEEEEEEEGYEEANEAEEEDED
ncbi:hypothetical protein ABW21_db0206957 [Orbilia brochopaga]|nr:hypothetical protein ABW21_db0206957 [Drechslerella brochopaga]